MISQSYYDALSSDRLFFRKLTYNDIESWMDFYKNNPNLKYLGIDLNRTNHEMAKAWIDAQLERYHKNEFGQLAMVLKETGELIGTRGISLIKDKGQIFLQSMGSVKPVYWRQGFGSESASCLYDFIFQHEITDTIVSICHLNNRVSQKYLEQLGFIQQEQLSTEKRDVFFYTLAQKDWKNKKEKR
ncbi:MAG: GNAT family N-acetyltransferase [Aureispira sp.]